MRMIINENDVAYVCRECGEAFVPENGDWPDLKRIHKTECDGATFQRTTIQDAF